MRNTITVSGSALAILLLGLSGGRIEAQSLKDGQLSGTVLSAGATVPNLSQAFVLTTPPEVSFILTQVCSNNPESLRMNAGPVIGDVPLEVSSNCTQYVPGIAIPSDTNINCFDHRGAGGNLRCMITGVLTK